MNLTSKKATLAGLPGLAIAAFAFLAGSLLATTAEASFIRSYAGGNFTLQTPDNVTALSLAVTHTSQTGTVLGTTTTVVPPPTLGPDPLQALVKFAGANPGQNDFSEWGVADTNNPFARADSEQILPTMVSAGTGAPVNMVAETSATTVGEDGSANVTITVSAQISGSDNSNQVTVDPNFLLNVTVFDALESFGQASISGFAGLGGSFAPLNLSVNQDSAGLPQAFVNPPITLTDNVLNPGDTSIFSLNVTLSVQANGGVTPEPAAGFLAGIGGFGLFWMGSRRNRRRRS